MIIDLIYFPGSGGDQILRDDLQKLYSQLTLDVNFIRGR